MNGQTERDGIEAKAKNCLTSSFLRLRKSTQWIEKRGQTPQFTKEVNNPLNYSTLLFHEPTGYTWYVRY